MTNYVQVINAQVAYGPGPLPQAHTFANGSKTGNFDLMDAATVKAEGFLPLVESKPALDARYQTYQFSNYTIGADNVTANYTVVSDSLANVKQDKIQQVLNRKFALLYAGITYNTHVFATDRDSLQSIAVSAFSASQIGNTWSSEWQLADGSFITMSQADILGLNTAVNARVLDLRTQTKTNIDAINALTDQVSVCNYVITMS